MIENASRYGVEKLFENDNVDVGRFLVHTLHLWHEGYINPCVYFQGLLVLNRKGQKFPNGDIQGA